MKIFWVYVFFVTLCIMGWIMVSPVHAGSKKQEAGGNPTSTATRSPTITRDPSITTIPLIIGIGQSNMAGEATEPVGPGTPSRTPLPSGAVMMKWNVTMTPPPNVFYWIHMEEPSDVWNGYPTQTGTPKSNANGYGASSAFLGRFMENIGWSKAAFINCGVGGTNVSDWAPSSPSATDATYFNDCWKRIASAQSNYHYEVVGVIVINGENETGDPNKMLGYADAMNRLYAALATRLNKPRLPMAFLKLAYPAPPTSTIIPTPARSATPGGPTLTYTPHPVGPRVAWYDVMATQQNLVAAYPTNNWGIAYPVGATRQPGKLYLHYASPADYDRIGIRLADALLTLMPSSTPTFTATPTATPTFTLTPTTTPTP